MSSRRELNDGIKSIKSAWQREHTARDNLEKMLKNAEAENAELRELVRDSLIGIDVYAEKYDIPSTYDDVNAHLDERIRKLGIEVGR